MRGDDRPGRALFCDRDGTLIEDVGYISEPDDVQLLPGAGKALRTFRQAGYRPVLISNQSGVGRGLFSREQLQAVHERFVELLAAHDAELGGHYYCLHAPQDGCGCRKPSPSMVRQACDELSISAARSLFVGDKDIDVAAGLAAGCTTVLLTGGEARGDPRPDIAASTWGEIVDLTLGAS